MSVGRHLLVEMALTGSARAKLHCVVIVFNERDHAQKHDITRSPSENRRLQTNAAKEQVLPFLEGEKNSPFAKGFQHIALRELDFAQGLNAERTSAFFFSDAGIISEVQLSVKTAREHAVMGVDQLIIDA